MRPSIPDPDNTALFLDVDGTLLDIVDDPSSVVADGQLITLIQAVSERLSGALALVSGRKLAEIDRIFAPAVFPAAGGHGVEYRGHNGTPERDTRHALPGEIVAALEALVSRDPGLLLEYKPAGVTLHYRQAPAYEDEARQLVATLMEKIGSEFRLINGKKVFEIAPRGINKGSALERFLGETAFAGRQPCFIGDDVTDEDGFRVVNDHGGISVRVGPDADSEAAYSLPGTAAVQQWLRELAAKRSS